MRYGQSLIREGVYALVVRLQSGREDGRCVSHKYVLDAYAQCSLAHFADVLTCSLANLVLTLHINTIKTPCTSARFSTATLLRYCTLKKRLHKFSYPLQEVHHHIFTQTYFIVTLHSTTAQLPHSGAQPQPSFYDISATVHHVSQQ